MRMLLILSIFVMFQSALAADQLLATITRKSDGVNSTLAIQKDDKSDAISFTFKIFNEDGKLDDTVIVRPKDLPQGKVVLEKMGIDVIKIKSNNFAEHNGGNITINYLKKWKLIGSNKYGNFEVDLQREGDDWVLEKDGERFTILKAIDHSKGIHRFEVVK
ncbi:MAG: hypothetical protein KC493_08580 [Bacteriovoracaceae bacterium]|nr:hypothetical protein [Bacteriovoracaceae bacterium]